MTGGLGPAACYFLRWRMRLRMRRFLRPTLRRPLPRRRLAMRSPLGGRGSGFRSETGRDGSVRDGPKGGFYPDIDPILKADMPMAPGRTPQVGGLRTPDRRSLRPRLPIDVRQAGQG